MKRSALFLAAISLAACSSAPRDPSVDYGKPTGGRANNTLVVPPDLVTPTRDDRFNIPGAERSAALSTYTAQQKAAAAGDSSVLSQAPDRMRIERAGSQRWLVVPGTPQTLYPKLKDFWQDLGFNIIEDKPELAVMETDWQENKAKLPNDALSRMLGGIVKLISDTDVRDKYRTRLERSSEPGMVEIFVSHRGAELSYANTDRDSYRWVLQPSDPEIETEMLRRVMLRLGVTEAQSKAAVDKVSKQAERARLQSEGGVVTSLLVDAPLDRAWRQVGLALDRVGVVVEDRDRSTNTYFVRYVVAADAKSVEGKNWFSSLAFWRSDKKVADTDLFRIVSVAKGEQTQVIVQDRTGKQLSGDSARRLLNLVYNEVK